MGKKVVIPGADFSANCIVIPLTITLGAGGSIIVDNVTYTNSDASDKVFEFDNTKLQNGQQSAYAKEIVFGAPAIGVYSQFFMQYTALKKIIFNSTWSSSVVSMFQGCNQLEQVEFNDTITNTGAHLGAMFSGCAKLTSLDLSNISDTSSKTSFEQMFSGCIKLESIKFGSTFIISNGASTTNMFYYCSKLTTIDCTAIDSTTTAGSTTKSKLEDAIANSTSVSNDITVNWKNGISRHWNGSAWS